MRNLEDGAALLKQVVTILALGMAVAPAAHADLLRSTKPGVMCRSADALAKLSRPDGSSPTVDATPSPAVQAIADAGGCNNFRPGTVVILVNARRNTSIVRADSQTGDGVLDTFFVPNVDYAPYTPPHTVFNDTVRARCPAKLDEFMALDPPSMDFVASLPAPVRAGIEQAVDNVCSAYIPCIREQRAVQIGKRNLDQRWAEFDCRQP